MAPLTISWIWPDTPVEILILVLLALGVRWLVNRGIRTLTTRSLALADRRRRGATSRAESLLADATGAASERYAARTTTLGSLLRSVSNIFLGTVTGLMIMAVLEVPLAPLLASAGVGGIALSFGVQSLVKDYISGVFMIVEDQYGVGDLVDFGGISGTVEEVGLRITRLRDASGKLWYIRNGEILRVGNLSQGWSTATIDIPVSYDEDPGRVAEVLNVVIDGFDADPAWSADLLERPSVAGVNSISGGTMIIRVQAKCPPNRHWVVQREFLERAATALNRAGVRGPVAGPAASGPPMS